MSDSPTLAEWKAREIAVRAHLAPSAPLPRAQVVRMSGMEVFEAIFRGELPAPPIGETMDFIPIQMAPGVAIFQGRPLPRHFNPLGTVHGGWFCTLLDSAMGCAVHTTLPAGKGYTTLEVKVNMVRPLTDAVELVRAEGKVLHVGRQVATAEGRLVDAAGKVYGHATTTCMLFEQLGQ